ncbi:MAG: hypothetical protein ACI9FN_001104 [Saprospiraceae bacterium]|jgi:hypothetical protein
MKSILFFLVVITISCNQPNDPSQVKSESIVRFEPSDLIGKTIEYKYGESIYHVTIDTESELHWEAIAGDEKGVKEEENYKIASIEDQKLFITWGEANGIGVSQVLDFDKGMVYNHLLRGRDITIGTGQIRILGSSN